MTGLAIRSRLCRRCLAAATKADRARTNFDYRDIMDRILFGDNQFFGVNHMSEEKARIQAIRFQDIKAVIHVLDDAYSEGIRTFMCTTHDRMQEVCDYFRANRD